MRRAWLNLRHSVPERRAAFVRGLERLGYGVVEALPNIPGPNDILVTWNRIREGHPVALKFEERGLPVLVTENASWGNDFAGRRWYTLARNFHNTAGRFSVGGNERWDSLDIDLPAFRMKGEEIVILPQRGIGPPQVAMPRGWEHQAQRKTQGRIRAHPGQHPCVPLEADLVRARCVYTWGSGAAIKALLWGIPVHSEMPFWIGEQDNTEAGRLAMFRRLAWAQWTLEEIAHGEPSARLLA